MRNRRSRAAFFCGAAMIMAVPAMAAPAASPAGEWMVAKGGAIVRIVDCAGRYWGLVTWEQRPGGIDDKNPNAALRNRPTLGMPILLGMAPSGGSATWSGQIYNSEDGRTYSGRISLAGPDKLRVEGCVLGFLCGGEEWRRVTGAAAMAAGRGVSGGATASAAKEPPSRVCSEVLRRH